MQTKIFFILPQSKSISDFNEAIDMINNDIIVSKQFTDNINYKDIENIDGKYYLDGNTITSSIKNNSILYINTMDNFLYGVTIDDFYNSDIIPMSLGNFNDISTNFIDKYHDSIIIVWYDTKMHTDSKQLKREINESEFLLNKINQFNYKFVYFLDNSYNEVATVLNTLITGNDNQRAEIFENYA